MGKNKSSETLLKIENVHIAYIMFKITWRCSYCCKILNSVIN
jgi:hypothetical protein